MNPILDPLNAIPKFFRVVLILGGYTAALVAAFAACWINDNFLLPKDVRDTGMAAGGDMILFAGVTFFLSIFPTALALFYLRSSMLFWTYFSRASLAFSFTGPLWIVLDMAFKFHQVQTIPMALMMLEFLAMMRLAGSPLMAMGNGLFTLLAPDPKTRWALLKATGIELLSGTLTYFSLLVLHRFP